ncbi:sulfur carrier protein ThiS [Candidatus Pyrohabitans sp.]
MAATVRYRNREISIEAGTSVKQAIRLLGLSPEGVVARVGSRLVTEDYRLRDGETLEIISAISGG